MYIYIKRKKSNKYFCKEILISILNIMFLKVEVALTELFFILLILRITLAHFFS